MPMSELHEEIEAGIVFWGMFDEAGLEAVMGLQHVADVALVRHAYTRSVQTSLRRAKLNTAFGDAGDETLRRRIRAHGNFIEYAPLDPAWAG